jgi:hypothetical protein
MANKYMKTIPISLVIKEMEIIVTIRYYLITISVCIIFSWKVTSVSEELEIWIVT